MCFTHTRGTLCLSFSPFSVHPHRKRMCVWDERMTNNIRIEYRPYIERTLCTVRTVEAICDSELCVCVCYECFSKVSMLKKSQISHPTKKEQFP